MSSEASQGTHFWAAIHQVFVGRWFTIFAAIMVMSFAGSTFLFGGYSDVIKSSLEYDQGTVELIGAYKDAGSNVGILAGLVAEAVPTWVVILIGAATNLFCYGFVWLATKGVVKPSVWQMCVSIFVGANSETFFATGALVTCVKNFPDQRGLVIGILKGYAALSGALITQVYESIYGGNEDARDLLFVMAWLPSVVSVSFLFTFRPMFEKRKPANETGVFRQFLYASIALALFVMAVTVAQFNVKLSKAAHVGSAVVVSLLLFLSLFVAVRAETKKPDTVVDAGQSAPSSCRFTWKSVRSVREARSSRFSCFGSVFDKPRRGEDYTILQALLSADMLILVGAAMFGLGSIFTAIDNMGQIGDALSYDPDTVDALVTLMNIWNFVGRVFAGFASETLLIKLHVSRPATLFFFMLTSCIGHVMIAFPSPGSIHAASIVLGISMGAMVPLICTIVSEIFGLRYYFTLYNCGQIASPLGAYVLNVFVAGRLYDGEASRPENRALGNDVCRGSACFGTSFSVVACVAFAGALLSFVLAMRTEEFYSVDIVRIYRGEMYSEFGDDVDCENSGENGIRKDGHHETIKNDTQGN